MTGRETRFSEVMSGPARLGAAAAGTLRLDLDVRVPGLLVLWGDVVAQLSGRVTLPGLADDPDARGSLEIAPLRRRRLRYRLDFRAHDGRQLRLDGWKTIRFTRPLHSTTTLPVTLYDEDGSVLGDAVVRFAWRDLPRFLATFRYGRPRTPAVDPVRSSRWRGQAGRLEVWYTTLTDPVTGTGAWLHHEIVAPASGERPYQHGWVALFPPGEPPVHTRVEPTDAQPRRGGDPLVVAGVLAGPDLQKGDRDGASWSLTTSRPGTTLWTFPRWAWRSELLPGVQVVTDAGARYSGTVSVAGRTVTVTDAPGAASRIYGHGNAQRWAWLHADLDHETVLEIVSAVSTLPGLRHLPPLTFVRLRGAGGDLPVRAGLLRAAAWRSHIDRPDWTVEGRLGRDRKLQVSVHLPPEQTLALDYAEPRGDRVVCRNSERADVDVTLARRSGGRWQPEQSWSRARHRPRRDRRT